MFKNMEMVLPCLGLFCVFNTHAANWPQFRSLQASGVDASAPAPVRWNMETGDNLRWRTSIPGLAHASPIVIGEQLYGCLDNGVLVCCNARNGAIHYSERLGSGSEGFAASPVSDGRHLYFGSEVGNVYVIRADEKFSVVATNKLGEICMASPALSDGTLSLRTREHVVADAAKTTTPNRPANRTN